MTTPLIYAHIDPDSIPTEYWSWVVDVERGDPRGELVPPATEQPILRDSQGQPLERWVVVYDSLPAAVWPPDARDEELFAQRGVTVNAVACFRQDPDTGRLPDVRHQDRLVNLRTAGDDPPASPRYWEVLTRQDVGEAGLLLLCHVRERVAGSG